MSLSDHLDDILDDNTNEEDLGLESIRIKRVTSNFVRDNATSRTTVKVDDNFSRKLNILYDALHIKKVVQKLEVVDYPMALEAMTGMEDPVILRAKLTKAPSIINKALVVSELDNVTEDLPTEYIERLSELNELYEETSYVRENLAKSLESLATSFLVEINRLSSTPPMVISEGASINLYTSPLVKVCSVDDSELMYDKYSGKLTHRFHKLFSGESIPALLQLKSVAGDVSTESENDIDLEVTEEEEVIASKLAEKIDNDTKATVGVEDQKYELPPQIVKEEESLECIAKAIHGNILMVIHSVSDVDGYSKRVSNLLSTIKGNIEAQNPNLLNEEVYFVISQIPMAYKQVTHILNVSDVLIENNNPIDQVLELLQFLD